MYCLKQFSNVTGIVSVFLCSSVLKGKAKMMSSFKSEFGCGIAIVFKVL
uniref:Uncharacterized protein n=1 Tax=Manihot esculenta TaxID=3983 RepID=A0A2C9UJT1_MANES